MWTDFETDFRRVLLQVDTSAVSKVDNSGKMLVLPSAARRVDAPAA